MKNQIHLGDQNTQQIGQNPDSQPTNIQNNPRINYWMILALVFGFLFFLMVGINLLKLRTVNNTRPFPNPSISPTISVGKDSFVGIVKTGAQLGEVKSHCSDGLYLVADEGKELIVNTGTKMLLLRLPGEPGESKMLSDQKYISKKVEVVGKYPAQEIFCEALICACEDYILVDHINIVDTESADMRQTKIEGQIDCLPHRDTSGGITLECAIGLQGKDGMYYGLQLNQQDVNSGKIILGQKVVITGIFTPSQDSKYNIIGTIEVASVEYTN
jgi:hypothetical protein